MRIARYRTSDGRIFAGLVEGDAVAPVAEESTAYMADAVRDLIASGGDFTPAGPAVPLADVELLSPVAHPEKIICIGLNYADHIRETGLDTPSKVLAFVKTAHTLTGPYQDVVVPAGTTDQLDWESELAVVMGPDGVFGYTVADDVSARDAQFADGQWFRGKNFDGFCPLGPWIVTADELPDPHDLAISARVNGETVQDSTTGEMIFKIPEIIAYLSTYMTLNPGDVIATGTPHGVGMGRRPPLWLRDGDVVECEVEGVGLLRNTVRIK
ncbi:fumarylacetoacetate hydrolase family protein [Herbidospora sp. NBRC 101105]|uniref:fumarylacetoacetate hydrolase family protein n=1 Tax=Herbidospora sp. NBRC 101105 TaxID=3032195 RepID=UPI0024A1034D|nr:fumarylacetoacetate hydrolase family protein [Herbidospora sp. NBRC 101105]GLX97209.1 hypothetical protein Hesp01_51590 [Herbidospora sp. NBRC 101105]